MTGKTWEVSHRIQVILYALKAYCQLKVVKAVKVCHLHLKDSNRCYIQLLFSLKIHMLKTAQNTRTIEINIKRVLFFGLSTHFSSLPDQ